MPTRRGFSASKSCQSSLPGSVNESQTRETVQSFPLSTYFLPVAKSAYFSIHHLPLCCADSLLPCRRICAVVMSLFIIRFISPISKCVHNIPSGNLLNCHINVILCKLNIYLSRQGGGGERKKERINNLQSWREGREAGPSPVHNSPTCLQSPKGECKTD